MNIVALVPARGGSKRVPRKNLRLLGGLPLIEWTIISAWTAALQVFVSTEDKETMGVAAELGAQVIACPLDVAHKDTDPDILWVRHALERVPCDAFVILRPTSPFRTAATINRALKRFSDVGVDCDSLRAVEAVKQSPYKMWRVRERDQASNATLWMTPLLSDQGYGPAPRHSSPTQTHPPVYVQNACIEVAWRETVERTGTIAGERIIPFFTEYPEGLDLNTEEDWHVADRLAHLLTPQDRGVPA